MRHRVMLLALSYALSGPGRSLAQRGPTSNGPPPEASQFDFLLGEWTMDVTSKSSVTPPRYHGLWRAAKTLNGLGSSTSTESRTTPARSCMQAPRMRVFDTRAGTWTMRYVDALGGQTGRWSELVGRQDGAEMHVEQRGKAPDWRTTILTIRYYNIQPNRFSWAADLSPDSGATWVRDYLRTEATRRSKAPPKS